MSTDWRPPILETSRLILRPIGEADAECIFRYASNPNVTEFTLFETHRDLGDTFTFLRDFAMQNYEAEVPGPYGACFKDDPANLLGTLGCNWATRVNKTMELGYAIAEEFWGRGIVAEASRAVISHVFASYEVVRLQAHCMAENTASARVMEKLGMTFEGKLRQATFRRGRSWDMLIYSVLRDEWPAV